MSSEDDGANGRDDEEDEDEDLEEDTDDESEAHVSAEIADERCYRPVIVEEAG